MAPNATCARRSSLIALVLLGLSTTSVSAQSMLASEPFASSAGALLGSNGGNGWAAAWEVQNNNSTVPGYGFGSQTSMTSAATSGGATYGTGGSAWQTAGRTLDVSSGGNFGPYLNGSTIGAPGQTLYFSALMRKDVNTDDEMSVTLHSGASPAWYVNGSSVSLGHFGADSNSGGVRYWSIRVNGVVMRSTAPVVVGQTSFLVVRISFGSSNVVSLFVDPPAASLPSTPGAEITTTSSVNFRSLALYGGSAAGQSSVDELRFGATYNIVVTAPAPVPSAPTGLTATPGDSQITLNWNATSGATAYRVYDIYLGSPRLQATVATNTALIAGLTNRTTYTLYVVAMNSAGSGAPSAQITAVPIGPAPAAQPALGTNLSTIVDYSREWPFVDAFKMARPWISQIQGGSWGTGPALSLDANGWPTSLQAGQYVETIIFDNKLDGQESYPTGNYTLLYDGQGAIAFDHSSATILSQSTGRMVVNVPGGTNGIYLMITATNPSNPIRNIRLIMPGYENTYKSSPFHPLFIARLKGYKVLRFMEWMLTNGSEVRNWSERPTPSDYTYVWRGAPLEVMIQLANSLGATPWFNLPAKATDDYATSFATLLNQQLAPSLKFYLEYSNETWNNGFSQTNWVRQQGVALNLSTDPVLAGAYYTSSRAVQLFSRVEAVFGGATRMVRAMGTQASNSWMSDQMLAYGNAFTKTDVLAIAPYFNCSDTSTGGFGVLGDPATATQVAAMTVEQINDIQLQHIQGCTNQQMTSSAAVARKYGMRMVAYEGGQSLVGYGGVENNSTITALFSASNRSARMNTLYAAYLSNWVAAGGDMFVHFTDVNDNSKWGNFGSLEYQDQDPNTAPKYQALMTFAAQHP